MSYYLQTAESVHPAYSPLLQQPNYLGSTAIQTYISPAQSAQSMAYVPPGLFHSTVQLETVYNPKKTITASSIAPELPSGDNERTGSQKIYHERIVFTAYYLFFAVIGSGLLIGGVEHLPAPISIAATIGGAASIFMAKAFLIIGARRECTREKEDSDTAGDNAIASSQI